MRPAGRRSGRGNARWSLEALEHRLALSAAAAQLPDQASTVVSAVPEIQSMSADKTAAAKPKTALPGNARLAARRTEQNFSRATDPNLVALHVIDSAVLTRGNQTVGFTLRFNQPLAESPASDERNYRAFEVSQPNHYLSKLLYQSDHPKLRDLPIASSTYMPDQNTVVLLLKEPHTLSQNYRIGLASPAQTRHGPAALQPAQTLTDATGNPLSVPITHRGRLRQGPILVRPSARIRLDQS